ncbi:MAG: hypothetical protein AB8H80_02570 [Planctomycetota bacterium]
MTNTFLRSVSPMAASGAAAAALMLGLLAAPICAQRVTVPDSGERTLQLFDLQDLGPASNAPSATLAAAAQNAARFLRQFVEPKLRDGDDLTSVGEHWLAAFADSERLAAVEQLLAVAKDHRNDQMTVEIRLCEISAKAFDETIRGLLGKQAGGDGQAGEEPETSRTNRPLEAMIPKGNAAAFLEVCAESSDGWLAAPIVALGALQRATIETVRTVPYVRDFEVERVGDAAVADPVIDTAWDGLKSSMTATFLPGGLVGVECRLQLQELQNPMPKAEVEVLAGAPLATIQLPRATGITLQSTAELQPGSLLVLASKRQSGGYLLAAVRADVITPR